ncbi:sensor histidine kinase [Argonema antarcticum]|uniref:sensor histidine kinase n=1 Tax=Argonema antarcticum TaxID=2942763 RepID=UPI00201140E6|nr:ATP-binding protein [Argonema antarcticum]MCL1473746.1 histidine kinase [Argonema antarcticum A004/B2]
MQFHKSRLSPESLKSYLVLPKSNSEKQRNTSKFNSSWIKRIIPRLSVAKKIGYGYSLAIGIAILGTTVGLVIGDYYRKQAYEQLIIADQQQDLLGELKEAVGEVRSHPQRLVTVLGESIWFEYESAKFFGDVNRVKTTLSKFIFFIDNNHRNLVIDSTDLKDLLKGYETNTESYTQLVKLLWQQIDPSNLKPQEIEAAQQKLLTFLRGKSATGVSVKFDRLSESLSRIEEAAKTQQLQANSKLEQAELLRLQIIVSSMFLSVAVATALGFYTSRQIARPIEWVNQVAQQVTQQSNFQLIVPVMTEDEVGSLATSLNQLVKWVGEYTHELEQARQTLEQRVEERTQELQQTVLELKETQSQLIQSEKMSSLGQLVAGIAHEINNPVNFIYGNIEYTKIYAKDLLELVNMYQQHYPNPIPEIQDKIEDIDLDFLAEDLQKILSSMKMGTERIRQIVLSLRNFSRLDEADMKPVDIHEGIENTLLILNSRLKRDIEVIKKYGDLPLVECYPAQLNQVFMNIIANAIDALEEVHKSRQEEKFNFSPQIIIRTEKVDLNYIRVGISDNGSGISSAIKDKLFDPFFTTKPIGKGTGLGLSICYNIIEKHKGKIEVISAPGEGTEFAIALPIQTQK